MSRAQLGGACCFGCFSKQKLPLELLEEQMEAICLAANACETALMFRPSGQVLAERRAEGDPETEEMMRSVKTLLRASTQFATTLDCDNSSTFHLEGDSRVLSCYVLNGGGEVLVLRWQPSARARLPHQMDRALRGLIKDAAAIAVDVAPPAARDRT